MRRFFSVIALLPAMAAADPGTDLFRDVMANGKLCSFGKGPTDRQECYVRAAPSRCEKEARSGVMGNGLLLQQFRACVMSCGNAGAWSSSVGECSRELAIEDADGKLASLIRQRDEANQRAALIEFNEAIATAKAQYPYLAQQSSELDKKAFRNFKFLVDQYLDAGINATLSVSRAASETDTWLKHVIQESRARSWGPPAQISTSVPAYKDDPICEFKQTMTDEDYEACGIKPAR